MFIVPLTQLPSIGKIDEIQGAAAAPTSTSKIPFADILQDTMQNAKQMQEIADKDSYDLAVGNTDNLAAVMINSAKAATALEASVQITSRVVSAYKEIMQMQV